MSLALLPVSKLVTVLASDAPATACRPVAPAAAGPAKFVFGTSKRSVSGDDH